MWYVVSTRTKEVAIRLAVGADKADIFRMVGWEGSVLSGAGIAAGLVGGGCGAAVRNLLFKAGAVDSVTLIGGSPLRLSVALAGSRSPAGRVMEVAPTGALGEDYAVMEGPAAFDRRCTVPDCVD